MRNIAAAWLLAALVPVLAPGQQRSEAVETYVRLKSQEPSAEPGDIYFACIKAIADRKRDGRAPRSYAACEEELRTNTEEKAEAKQRQPLTQPRTQSQTPRLEDLLARIDSLEARVAALERRPPARTSQPRPRTSSPSQPRPQTRSPTPQQPRRTRVETDAIIYDDLNRDLVQALADLVKQSGYRCDTISSALPCCGIFPDPGKYTLSCNQYRYEYRVEDRGGRWTVTVK